MLLLQKSTLCNFEAPATVSKRLHKLTRFNNTKLIGLTLPPCI